METMRLPLFIESLSGANLPNLHVCHMVMGTLFKYNITPLPFASNQDETRQVAESLRRNGSDVALFVVNSFLAEDMLRELDPFIAERPLLILHREIFSFHLIRKRELDETSKLLRDLRPRLTAVCGYGSQTAHLVADRVALAIMMYLKDGNFAHVEGLSTPLAMTAQDES